MVYYNPTKKLCLTPLVFIGYDLLFGSGGDYIFWLNDALTNKHTSRGAFPISETEQKKYIANLIGRKDKIVWGILPTSGDKKLIGVISLQEIDFINRTAELAIVIGDKDFRNKGIGKIVCDMVLHHGFIKLNLKCIWLGCHIENKAMCELSKNIGMSYSGYRRGNNSIAFFDITREEWDAKN